MKTSFLFFTCLVAAAEPEYFSPQALAALPGGKQLYIALGTANKIAVYEIAAGRITSAVSVPGEPTGVVAARESIYATCDGAAGAVAVIESGSIVRRIPVGPGPRAPALAPDGKTLYVANRFGDSVSIVDLDKGAETVRIPLPREPYATALTPDGKLLLAATHLPAGPATAEVVASEVCFIDVKARRLERCIPLANGSSSARGLAVSPDGAHAYVSHIVGRFTVHTTQLEQGWMNTNAVSVISVKDRKRVATVLADDVDNGAANPWAVAVSPDGRTLCVTHAGTHEASLIDLAALHRKLSAHGGDPVDELAFLGSARVRLPLPGLGPRALTADSAGFFVAEYFSGSLARIEAAGSLRPRVFPIPLQPGQPSTPARLGEMLFHDARRCFQRWQSCSSCHPDGRTDGLNWDLMNDGIGNPKNVRSLLLSHLMPPVMSTGVRPDVAHAVRSGLRHIQFSEPREDEAQALEEYLKSLAPRPSPHLEAGQLSAAAERGKRIFFSREAGCVSCHRPPLYTDGLLHDGFKTPTLIEVWRTGPYFHDGRYSSLRDAIVAGNRGGVHKLTPRQLDDLVEFVRSL